MKVFKKWLLLVFIICFTAQSVHAAYWASPSEWWEDTKKNAYKIGALVSDAAIAGITLYYSLKNMLSRPSQPAKINNRSKSVIKSLISKSNNFAERHIFYTQNNRISSLIRDKNNSEQVINTISRDAQKTTIIMHKKVEALIQNFLNLKKEHGTNTEKNLYQSLSKGDFIKRLITKRPLMFMTASDQYLLKNGTKGRGGFEFIGTTKEKNPLTLKDYLSYDEMALAALLGVSVPTYFINNGDRNNKGINGTPGSFEKHGVYVGLVGARFEKQNVMEWKHMVVTKSQNTAQYGKEDDLLKLWAKFYELESFTSYTDASKDTTGRFQKIGKIYLDTIVYKKRLKMTIAPFLLHAHALGSKANKKVYCHVVGLGLGVWQLDAKLQTKLMLEVYEEILKEHTLSAISDIDFSWFSQNTLGSVKNNEQFTQNGNNITVHFSKRNPADPLTGKNAGKLLIAMYAWDGNSYPGNEYWIGALTASGDPAAACCSTIPELQNPEINDHLLTNEPLLYGK